MTTINETLNGSILEGTWLILDMSVHPDMLGFIPDFFKEDDERPMAEQANERYIGGWRPMKGWTFHTEGCRLSYPGETFGEGEGAMQMPDEVYSPIAVTKIRDELILIYNHAWVCIVDAYDPTIFQVSRMD